VGYVYQTTGQQSTYTMASAQIKGNVIGIYSFRRNVVPPPPV
jgi:hypothetical protein